MNETMPRTPFSTQLSGSAREAELRIRNIFSGPKKRPPLPLIILTAAVCLLCGNLVSCQQRPAAPVIAMETQYYDTWGNYVEIPALLLPDGEENEAVDAMNAALDGLRDQYSGPLTPSEESRENQCLFYPSTTGRYLNLLFYQDRFKTDLNTGHVFSLVYDLKEGALVSAEDALALAGLNESALLEQVTRQVQSQLDQRTEEIAVQIAPEYQNQGFQLTLHNLTLEGFRIKADGQPVFYLTGREDDADDGVLDVVSGSEQLYIWEDRKVDAYDQYNVTLPNLVPAGETDRLDPPLWNQWYFAGEEPEGGFVSRYVPGEDPYGGNFYDALLDGYAGYQDQWTVYYASYQSDSDRDGCLRVGPAEYLGEIPLGENTCAAVYDVYYTFSHNTLYAGSVWGFDWDVNREMVVLSRSTEDGSFTGLLGRASYNYRMDTMAAEEIIRQVIEN